MSSLPTATTSLRQQLNRKRIPWPEWAVEYVRTYYQEKGDSELAEDLTSDKLSNRSFDAKQVEKRREKLGLKRTRDQLSRILARNKEAGRYQRRPDFQHSRAVAEGETRIWREKNSDGTYRETKRIKINGELISLSYHIYEQKYGPVPKGHVLAFRDGDPLNCELDNLLVMTRAENIARNRNFGKSQQRQRETNEQRHVKQRAKYLELMQETEAIDSRIDDLEGGSRDESYTVDLLNTVLKGLRAKKNELLLEVYKLPESVKHK